MKVDRTIRLVIAVLIAIAFVIGAGALLMLTESALNIWARLEQAPAVIRYGYISLLSGLIVLCIWLVWRFVVPRRKLQSKPERKQLSEEQLREQLAHAGELGVETTQASSELQRLADERGDSRLTLALFGEVSTGKSSLVNTLLPGAAVEMSPLAGSTTQITRFSWQSESGAQVQLVDLPGLQAVGKTLDEAMLDEARRAHAVIFVIDGDMNRQQVNAMDTLRALDKPMVVALNKADRYDAEELRALREHIAARLAPDEASSTLSAPAFVVTTAAGQEPVMQSQSDGTQTSTQRDRVGDISQLVMALDELLGRDLSGLRALREQALLSLASEKLDAAQHTYREQRALQIVSGSTKKAVLGALAAVTPGSDIVIQGFLATSMTRELCKLYEQAPRDLDIEKFLDLSQSRVGKALPLSLAIAGNGLKSFPGVGTVAGGLVHAVAYGLIFDALGRGLARSLASGKTFSPQQAAADVAEGLDEYLEKGVARVARLALEQQPRRD